MVVSTLTFNCWRSFMPLARRVRTSSTPPSPKAKLLSPALCRPLRDMRWRGIYLSPEIDCSSSVVVWATSVGTCRENGCVSSRNFADAGVAEEMKSDANKPKMALKIQRYTDLPAVAVDVTARRPVHRLILSRSSSLPPTLYRKGAAHMRKEVLQELVAGTKLLARKVCTTGRATAIRRR